MEEETHKHIKRLHIYILLLTVSVFALLWYFLNQQRVKQPSKEPTEESKIVKEERGAFSLQTKDNQRAYSTGTPFTLQVLADSDKEDVVGFDVLLSYGELDLEGFDVLSVTSPLPGFRVIESAQRGHLSITGIQDPQNSTRQILKNTVILEVTLVPKVVGEQQLSIILKADPETSKMVTAQTTVLYPKVEGLMITVR